MRKDGTPQGSRWLLLAAFRVERFFVRSGVAAVFGEEVGGESIARWRDGALTKATQGDPGAGGARLPHAAGAYLRI